MTDGRRCPTTAAQSAELTRRAHVEAYLGKPWSTNLALASLVEGPFNQGTFAASVEEVVKRHESLRTGFTYHRERWHQTIVKESTNVVAVHDLVDLSSHRAQNQRVEQILRDACNEPFIAHQTPKLRASVIKLGPDRHIVGVVVDHIAADGWSLGVIVIELSECYAAAGEGG